MPTIVTKSIGTNKDYATLKLFNDWASVQKLVTNDQMIIGEVYTDLNMFSAGYGVDMKTAENDKDHYVLIRPAAGLGINDIYPDTADQQVGPLGITLTAQVGTTASSLAAWVQGGVELSGFRIRVTGGPSDDVSSRYAIMMGGSASPNRPGVIRSCRFDVDVIGAAARVITTGNTARGGYVTDCIFHHRSGSAQSMTLNNNTMCERNLFVRTGTAVGYPCTNGVATTLKDNIYIGCGTTPAVGLPTAASANVVNNYTDTAPTTPYPSGLTVMTTAELIRDINVDFRPPANSTLIGKGSAAAKMTYDMHQKFRGSAPDVGPFQKTAQALPPKPVGTITSQAITDQNITVSGTVTNDPTSGTVTLRKLDGTVIASKAVTFKTATTWEAAFTNIAGGDYLAPLVVFTNFGGTSDPATGGAPYNIYQPLTPVAVVQKQFLVGDTLTLFGTVANVPVSGTVSVAVGATPDGAVAVVNATTLTFDVQKGTFMAYLYGLTPGNYAAPEVKFTNNGGTGTATGAQAVTVVKTPTPVVANVNVQMVGKGQTHANLAAFQTWMNARTGIPAGEVVHAYVTNYQSYDDLKNLTLAPKDTATVIVSPAPGLSVLDRHPNAALNWYDDGMELMVKPGMGFIIRNGVSVQGFRIKAVDAADLTVTDKYAIYLTSTGGNTNLATYPGPLKGNHIYSSITDASNRVMGNSEFATQSVVSDNLFIQEEGQGYFFTASNAYIERNTIVRRGNALGTTAGKHTGTGSFAVVRDNIFLGCGSVPVLFTSASPTAPAGNLIDTAQATQYVGFTLATAANIVATPGTDYRPKAAGAAIGKASTNAVSTGDMTDRNRGPAPDVGCWQLNSYVPVPTGIVQTLALNGTNLRITGSHARNPLNGFASVLPATTNPGSASPLPEKPLVLTETGWSVEWSDLSPGNYAVPVVYLNNAGGRSANLAGGVPFSVILIGGNPRASAIASDAPPAVPPDVKITKTTVSGNQATLEGTVNFQNDPLGKIEVFIDPLTGAAATGPLAVTVDAGTWKITVTIPGTRAIVRAVATAYDIPVLASANVTLLNATGTIMMPVK
jgi:uncharacterized protein (DUF2141 family)